MSEDLHIGAVPDPDTVMVSPYCNWVTIKSNGWDFLLTLGQQAPSQWIDTEGGDDDLAVQLLGRVFMTPRHAKAVSLLLQHQIEKYEELYGPIVLPESLNLDDS